jgi:hypothetical protein
MLFLLAAVKIGRETTARGIVRQIRKNILGASPSMRA